MCLPTQVSPICVGKLEAELVNHPDQRKVNFVLSGFRHGFHPHLVTLYTSPRNVPSALLQPAVIDEYLLDKLEKGRVVGPFLTPLLPNLHVSHFGMIPKKYQLRKWHFILNFSSLTGASANDSILKNMYLFSM